MVINKLSEQDLQRLGATKVETLTHPEADLLQMDIYELEDEKGCFFLWEHGDYYDTSWVDTPLEECKEDAMSEMNSRYNGTYQREDYGCISERKTFRAMQS